jgi:hypothetical protein
LPNPIDRFEIPNIPQFRCDFSQQNGHLPQSELTIVNFCDVEITLIALPDHLPEFIDCGGWRYGDRESSYVRGFIT